MGDNGSKKRSQTENIRETASEKPKPVKQKKTIRGLFKGISASIRRRRELIDMKKVYRFFRNTGVVLLVLSLPVFLFTDTARYIALLTGTLGAASLVYGLASLQLEHKRFARFFKLVQILVGTAVQVLLFSFIIVTIVTVEYSKSDEFPLVDYCIVPGAKVYGEIPGEILAARIVDTADFLRQYTNTKAILCGGLTRGADITEAQSMYNGLVGYGIDPDRLILEESSHDTEQNMRNAKRILDDLEGNKEHRVVVISSEFHLMRCRNLASKVGMKAFGYHVNTPQDTFILQDSYVREYFSNIIYIVELVTRR